MSVGIENKYYMCDIEGTLYYKDTPVIEFCIKNYTLQYAKDLSGGKYYPHQLFTLGVNYLGFNTFFNDRVVRDNAMWIRDYLDKMGLKYYDMEELVKKTNGWDVLGLHWIKFKDIGAKCYDDLFKQRYPIY